MAPADDGYIHHGSYSDPGIRTQIHLEDEDLHLLDRESRATGASRSELIRRAVRTAYGKPAKRPRLTSFGVAPELAMNPAEIDEELARIFEERYERWHR